MGKYTEVSAVGRFQPLHNGHLRYLLAAKQQCDYLWIGISQYDVYSLSTCIEDPHRQKPENNPLTYFERVEMITNALLFCVLKRDEFGFVPFPIETPERLGGFLSTTIPIFTTLSDGWNEHKINLLKKLGYSVIVLWEDRAKELNGTTIRQLICAGNESWKQMVPRATIEIIEKYKIRDRIINLKAIEK